MKRMLFGLIAALAAFGCLAQTTDRLTGLSTSVAVKPPVAAVTNAPITLSGEQTVNSVAVVAGNRVLVKDQADATANGIYVVATTTWARAADFDGARDVVDGTLVVSNSGTAIYYRVTSNDPITIGTSDINFDLVSGSVTQSSIGLALFPRTDAEIAASCTPVNYFLEYGVVDRFATNTTPGTTDMSAALQCAIDQNAEGGEPVKLLGEEYAFATTLELYYGSAILGAGPGNSTLTYTGAAQAFKNATPGTRIYNVVLRDFFLNDGGTGTIGFDFDSVSQAEITNVLVTGFGVGIKVYSPTAGYSVYNRFYDVKVQSATTGYWLTGTSSNANTFISSRCNICTTAVLIEDSNDNSFTSSQFESGGDGIHITASIPGISPRNYIAFSRFEGNSGTNIIIGTDVSETALFANFHADGVPLSDSGTRTQIFDTQSTKSRLLLQDGSVSTDGPAFTFTRSSNAGSSVPVMQVNDTNTGSGTPNTLEINTERNAGKSLTIKRASAEQFSVTSAGVVAGTQFIPDVVTFANADATPTVAAGDVFITTGTTAITDFDNGVLGQCIRIVATDNITITNNASIIKLAGAANYSMTADDMLSLCMFVDQVWTEAARSVN